MLHNFKYHRIYLSWYDTPCLPWISFGFKPDDFPQHLHVCVAMLQREGDHQGSNGSYSWSLKVWVPCFLSRRSMQDFPEVGHNPMRGREHTILPNFPKNCMKFKEFGYRGLDVHPSPPPNQNKTKTFELSLNCLGSLLHVFTMSIGRSKGGARDVPPPHWGALSPVITINELKSIYNNPFKGSRSHHIHTHLAMISSNDFDLLQFWHQYLNYLL